MSNIFSVCVAPWVYKCDEAFHTSCCYFGVSVLLSGVAAVRSGSGFSVTGTTIFDVESKNFFTDRYGEKHSVFSKGTEFCFFLVEVEICDELAIVPETAIGTVFGLNGVFISSLIDL